MTLAVVLFVYFGYRYALRAHKFMPSGMIAVVSLIVLGVMFLLTGLDELARQANVLDNQ